MIPQGLVPALLYSRMYKKKQSKERLSHKLIYTKSKIYQTKQLDVWKEIVVKWNVNYSTLNIHLIYIWYMQRHINQFFLEVMKYEGPHINHPRIYCSSALFEEEDKNFYLASTYRNKVNAAKSKIVCHIKSFH